MLALKLGTSLPSNNAATISPNNYSLAFNGTDEYVSVDEVADDIDTDTGTISIWAKINTTSVSVTLLQFRTDVNNNLNFFYHAAANEGRFTYKAGGSAKVSTFTDAIEGDGKWHHIAATWDTAADEIKLYLDGVLKDTVTSLGTYAGSGGDCDIASNTIGGGFFNGNLTEVSIFTRVVPISELFILRREPLNLTGSADLVGYWKFEEGSGTEAADSSGKGSTGTLVNTPTWSTLVP